MITLKYRVYSSWDVYVNDVSMTVEPYWNQWICTSEGFIYTRSTLRTGMKGVMMTDKLDYKDALRFHTLRK